MKISNQKEIISLVTGGAGFIGSHVADELVKMGHTVIILDDLSGGFERNINSKCRFIKGSVTDEKILDYIFNKYKIDYVYHLAAYAAEGLSHFIRKFNYENNLIGSVNLINRSVKHDIKHFVFTSSIAVYGTNQNPLLESLNPKPEDPYGIAKFATELDLKSAHELFGLTFTIFRPHNVYGERQNYADPYRNVLGIFINNILKNQPMPIFGDGTQKRAFSYIDDVAPYIARCIENNNAKNEIINIGADEPYTVFNLAHKIAKSFDIEPNILFLPPRVETAEAYSDHSKAKRIFKIKNTVKLDDGIKKMVKWAIKLGPMDPQKFENIELYKNIPSGWKKLI